MTQPTVLLLSVGPSGILASAIQPFLENVDNIQVRCQTLMASGLVKAGLGVWSSVSSYVRTVVLCCGSGSAADLLELLRQLQSTPHPPVVVLVSDILDPAQLWELVKAGAAEFLVPPLDAAHVMPRLNRLFASDRESLDVRDLKEKLSLQGFVGESPALLAEIQKIPAIARCDASALIVGETGTGKELCARAIHYLSLRSAKPFIAVNCGAIPCELIENELFGHEPGAYTGATTSAVGLIQEAEGGTLFLDEADSLPLLAQVKLLRFLQEKEYRRLGSRKTCAADVRVVAATNANLDEAVRDTRFRQDLFYRLNTVTFALPPLRARIGDISLLARHFLRKRAKEYQKPAAELSPPAIQKLVAYDWPGNVRELDNVITRCVLLTESYNIQAIDLHLPGSSGADVSFRELKAATVAQFEQRYLTEMLLAFDGNISQAAKAAHKNRRAFFQLMRKHHIHPSILTQNRKPVLTSASAN